MLGGSTDQVVLPNCYFGNQPAKSSCPTYAKSCTLYFADCWLKFSRTWLKDVHGSAVTMFMYSGGTAIYLRVYKSKVYGSDWIADALASKQAELPPVALISSAVWIKEWLKITIPEPFTSLPAILTFLTKSVGLLATAKISLVRLNVPVKVAVGEARLYLELHSNLKVCPSEVTTTAAAGGTVMAGNPIRAIMKFTV